jgi:predicted flap endonuclease-1-like 5' DNA nuclease
MIYLLAKYTLLFLLTAALGFILGYWWSRRNFVDVSESYEDLRKANERSDASNWNQLWQRFDELPQPEEINLSPVYERIEGVADTLANIPRPEPVSLVTVEYGLQSLTDQVASMPVPAAPKDPDLNPVLERIEKLEQIVSAIPAPADLGPVSARIQQLEKAIREIPKPEPHEAVDLQPIRSELTVIRNRLHELPKEGVDLQPVTRQISSLEKRFSDIPRPEVVDLEPVDRRLSTIETEIGKIGQKMAGPADNSVLAERTVRRSEPRILSAALYGEKDDLKQISGVGPKLERLLNKNGVYYYWQVASWSRSDIDVIDKRLDAFKGRITRDDWVTQAQQLKLSPSAARIPAEY